MKDKPQLISLFEELTPDKKLYFASDFHLGVPNQQQSLERELKIVRWLQRISNNAAAIFLVGDLFDFWFEYKSTIPKGFVRFQGKLAELVDNGIPIFIFTGNHDLWMKDYFPNELNIPVFKEPITLEVRNKKILVGHGDGLGPGEYSYKFIKYLFTNPIAKWLFGWLHPTIAFSIAKFWSKRSRLNSEKKRDSYKGENEILVKYCQTVEKQSHHDFYIFGHRHFPSQFSVSKDSTYFNLGDWIKYCTYLEFDGEKASLKNFNQ